MVNMRHVAWMAGLSAMVGLLGCETESLPVQIELLTETCPQAGDRVVDTLSEVSHLEIVLSGEGLAEPVVVFAEADEGLTTVDALPLDPDGAPVRRDIRVLGHFNGPQGAVIASGRSSFVVDPTVEGTVRVPVFIRPVQSFVYPSTPDAPDTCVTLQRARADHTATLLPDGRVFLAGGRGVDGIEGTAELYDPATGALTRVDGVGLGRADHSATRLRDGRVLLAGGEGPGGAGVAGSTIFDPAADAFESGPALALPRARHTAVRLQGDLVVVAGGRPLDGSDAAATASTEYWRPGEAAFQAGPSLPEPKADHCAVTLNEGSSAGFAGGLTLGDPDVEVSDRIHFLRAGASGPELLTDDRGVPVTAYLTAPRLGLACARSQVPTQTGTRDVLVAAGGFTDVTDRTQASAWEGVDVYDASRGVSELGTLGDGARGYLCATEVAEGVVVFLGGQAADAPDASRGSERATLGTSSLVTRTGGGALNDGRYGHTCTTLQDGTVLVAGGHDVDGRPLSTVEIYTPFVE